MINNTTGCDQLHYIGPLTRVVSPLVCSGLAIAYLWVLKHVHTCTHARVVHTCMVHYMQTCVL